MVLRQDEYLTKGDYHKNPEKNWRFYPVYVEKMKLVERFIESRGINKKILDLGCGEGVLVEKLRNKKFDIFGIDLNYESDFVIKRDVINTGFPDSAFDIVLCLDVIEHLHFENQDKMLAEIKRILKPKGLLVMTIPNLAHFVSRLSFLFVGRLIRTSEVERHKGDRPIVEYLKMLRQSRFIIEKRKGLFPTFPLVSAATYFFPRRVVFWHRILNKILAYSNWCFLNFLICRNEK